MFNLYKFGKLHKVIVDGILSNDKYTLICSVTYNMNIVGPLQEKTLIKLHFDGKYESTDLCCRN